MVMIRNMQVREAERVRDLWLQMCAQAGTPLPDSSAQLILANLKQYAAHQMVQCFIAEESHSIIGFVTCSVTGHPVMPGLTGDIEELYVQPGPHHQAVKVGLVRQAVIFMKERGTANIHTRICVGNECPEESEMRMFWQSLGWENDMTIYSIYSNVPGDPILQRVWDEYLVHSETAAEEQQP